MTPIRAKRSRKAVVLLAVLVTVVLLSLAAYKYSDYMLSEYRANEAAIRAAQARLHADSGVHYAAAMLAAEGQGGNTLNGNPWDNPDLFQHVAVGAPDSQGRQLGRFSIVSLRSPEDASTGGMAYVFGATDEAAKINLNGLIALDNGQPTSTAMKILMAFRDFGMTEDVAAAILDWLDVDDTPRTSGAENEYYSLQELPYRCKNGPLDSLEELLLVRGVTVPLLFGNDKNRNGTLDPDEGEGTVDRGLSAFFTVYSREANADSTGKARINLNGSDVTLLQTQLTEAVGEELAYFILAYKLFSGTSPDSGGKGGKGGTSGGSTSGGSTNGGGASGGSTSGGSTNGGASGGSSPQTPTTPTTPPVPLDAAGITKVQEKLAQTAQSQSSTSGQGGQTSQGGKKGAGGSLRSLWELINGTVTIPVADGTDNQGKAKTKNVVYASPLKDAAKQREMMPILLDKCTLDSRTDLRPRVNPITASPTVLAAFKEVAGLTDNDVQTIVSKRPTPDQAGDPIYKTVTWLLTECNIPPATMRRLDRYVTGKTQVYRIQSLGYSERGGPTARVEAVIDTNMGRPRIAYWRDLSELGRGFELGSPNR